MIFFLFDQDLDSSDDNIVSDNDAPNGNSIHSLIEKSENNQRSIQDYFGIDSSSAASPLTSSSSTSAPSFNNDSRSREILSTMFPNCNESQFSAVFELADNWDEAIDMITDTVTEPTSGREVIQSFIKDTLLVNEARCAWKIARENIWREGLRLYKIALADRKILFTPLLIDFENEEGIDAGALTIEFFTKFFESAEKELFESTPAQHLIPKGAGGNMTLFKAFSVSLGHSLLQGGPPFQFLPSWCYAVLSQKAEDEIAAIISESDYLSLIPLNAGTAVVISFLKELSNINTNAELDYLFDVNAEGPAYEQIVNSTQWPIDTKITLENIETLKAMIVWEELVIKREKQLNAIREGLSFIGVLPLIKTYPTLLSEYFVASERKISSQRMLNIINWESADVSNHTDSVRFLKQFIESSDSEQLIKLLKFATGFSVLSSLNRPAINIAFSSADKALPEADACFSILRIPTMHKCFEEFKQYIDIALNYGCEGYGNI